MKRRSKVETKEVIEDFFSDIKNKTPKEIKKIKKLAMSHNIKLGDKKKLFCKKCFTSYIGKEKVRLSNGMKSVTCGNCGYVARWKIK